MRFVILSLLVGVASPALAFQTEGAREPAGQEKSDVLRGFRGLVVGRLVEKDVEKGTFSVKVDRIVRVWRNNEARNPARAVGTTMQLEGVEGKFLDKLLVIKRGETLQFGALDTGGERLRVGVVAVEQ